jgi:molybdate transport system ATP-binding protein
MIKVDVERRLGELDLAVAFEANARVTALFGRSGAGKTSLVNMIAGLMKPDRGHIEIDGQILFDSAMGVNVPVQSRRIGYVFQEGRLFPHYSVRRNLMYGRDHAPEPERYVDFGHIVELLGLKRVLDRRPGDLSGGEKQRVAIGRALLASPRILLLDEPLASLDAKRKSEIMEYIELMRDDIRIPMIFVSHAVDEVVRLADRVVLLSAGRVAGFGAVEEIMGRPELTRAEHLFEGGTVIDARVTAQDLHYDLATLSFDGGALLVTNVDALVGDAVRVRIRARDVSLALERPHGISIQNVLHGHITGVTEPQNGAVGVSIAVGAITLRSRVTLKAREELQLKPGLEVFAMVKAVSLDRHGAGHV